MRAADYLLKPVKATRLAAAVEVARARLATRPPPPLLVTARSGATVRAFDASTIRRFRAAHKYTAFEVDGVEQLTEESLGALETRLAPLGFVRVHRAELVRRSAIRTVTLTAGDHHLVLDDGQVVPVSRRLVAALKQQLSE